MAGRMRTKYALAQSGWPRTAALGNVLQAPPGRGFNEVYQTPSQTEAVVITEYASQRHSFGEI
jgi:hypothetical protein